MKDLVWLESATRMCFLAFNSDVVPLSRSESKASGAVDSRTLCCRDTPCELLEKLAGGGYAGRMLEDPLEDRTRVQAS